MSFSGGGGEPIPRMGLLDKGEMVLGSDGVGRNSRESCW